MIRRLYEKHETILCLALIGVYVFINSYCQQNFGTTDYRSCLTNIAFAAALFALTVHLNKTVFYGLTSVTCAKDYLYFLPLALIATVNLWGGIAVRNSATEILFHVVMMLNVGFIEEMLFRGFLFRLMEKDNLKLAMLVSAITFGMGHIVNLLNGEALISTLLQLCYATAIGWLFVVIFRKSKSLWPCIVTHGVLNALSIFNVGSEWLDYVGSALLIVVSLGYAAYIERAGAPAERE